MKKNLFLVGDESVEVPAHLRPDTARWFCAVLDDYELEEHHVRLLILAGEAWDRCGEAREQLAKEGLTVDTRQGIKAHPAVRIEADSRAAFAALVKQIGLDDVDELKRGPGRPGGGGCGITWRQLEGLPERRPGKRQRRS
jgi:phage terminase small subunit